MKKSAPITFLIYGAAVAVLPIMLGYLCGAMGLRIGQILGILCSYILSPIAYLMALNVLYKDDKGERGAGSVFIGALIVVGISIVIGFVMLLINGSMDYLGDWFGFMLPQFLLSFGVLMLFATISSQWRLFKKAGEPGWASIVPIYNIIVQCKIAGAPAWWVIMFFIPIVSIVFAIMLVNKFVKAFGKDSGFTVGMILLPLVFMPILAYGNTTYTKPVIQAA